MHFVVRSAKDFVKHNLRDRRAPTGATADDSHLDAAVGWLLRSIDECGGEASSKGYRFLRGWMPPYPETSGYIIPTLLALAHDNKGSPDCVKRAERIAQWLTRIQLPDGGFRRREVDRNDEPDVFDTGMILLGFNALLHEKSVPEIKASAQKAADFLASSLDDSGCFVRHLSHGIWHAYNVRAAWGLVGYGLLTNQDRYVQAGLANATWTLRQQNEVGYYANNAFKKDGNANTHGVAYVMQGLLQIYDLSDDQACRDSVVLAADSLQALYRERGWLAAELGPNWEYLSRHICLTGYAQLAIVFLRLFELTDDNNYRVTAERLLGDVGATQELDGREAAHHGAIAGSFPIYGRYAPLQYPNWATKFFIDAMLAKNRIDSGEQTPAFLKYGN